MAIDGVEGTAVGLNPGGRLSVQILLERPGVGGIPQQLDGIPVYPVVTGKIYALPKPTGPKAPRGLTATDVGTDYVSLDWRDNREPGVTYNVYSWTDGTDRLQIANELESSSYTDWDLAPGTAYYYVVTAQTGEEESRDSETVLAVTLGGTPDTDAPSAPTSLTAEAISSSAIALDWADNPEPDVSHYNVYRDGDLIASGVGPSAYEDTGLLPETTYSYEVEAVDTSDNPSLLSYPASATTMEETAEPPIGPRPAPIGVSTGHPNITAGTIGCRVTRTEGGVLKYYALARSL
jgi:hypothetical protein